MASEFLGLDRGRLLLEALGSFWTRAFQDKEVTQSMMDSVGESYAQSYFDLLEIILSKSVFDIPVFHREKWTLLTFLESDLNKNSGAFLKYNGEGVYGPQPEGSQFGEGFIFNYGGLIPGVVSFGLPQDLVNIESYILNRIHDPTEVFVKGKDFLVRDGVVFFAENPFENDLIPKTNIIDETGALVDRQIGLWALNSDYDFQFLWKNYGFILDFFMESSENYKTFIQAVWSLFYQGPRFDRFVSAVNGLLGLPVIREAQETVEAIFEELEVTRVVTDKHEYQLRPTATLSPVVIPGAVLDAFTPLAAAVVIIDSVTVPKWWNNRDFVPLPASILTEDFIDSLIIPRKLVDVPNVYGATFDSGISGTGFTQEQKDLFENFPLPWGTPGLVFGQPTGVVTVDVMDLLMTNYFSNHLILLEVDTSQVVSELISAKFLDIINDALPAYVHFIGLLDIPLEDTYDLEENVPDPRDNPCFGIPDPNNSGTEQVPSEPSTLLSDYVFMEGLYDPFIVISGSGTVDAGGLFMTVTSTTPSDFTIGDTLRLGSDIVVITGLRELSPSSIEVFFSVAATPGPVGSIEKLLIDFEDVYTITVLPGAVTFSVSTESALDNVASVAFPGFGVSIPFGSFNLEVRFEDAPSGAAFDGVLVAGDRWTFNVRANFLGGTRPGLVDPGCLRGVGLDEETYESPTDFQDGYWGIPRWGDPGLTWGMSDPQTGAVLTWGRVYFIPSMRVFLRTDSCAAFSGP